MFSIEQDLLEEALSAALALIKAKIQEVADICCYRIDNIIWLDINCRSGSLLHRHYFTGERLKGMKVLAELGLTIIDRISNDKCKSWLQEKLSVSGSEVLPLN